jgi:hypothetical protein
MTSPTNTAGLVAEIDAEMQGRRRGYADVRGELLFRCRDSLVTAASAQARIAALEALVSKSCDLSVEQTDKLLAMHDRAQAAEARADRLATLVKRLSEDLSAALERAYEADAEWVKAKYPNGASPIRLLAAIQDQPK